MGPISTKLGTKHPWVKGIQFCPNERPRPFPRTNNYEIAKLQLRNLIKSSFLVFSQVIDVAHGPLVVIFMPTIHLQFVEFKTDLF